MNANIYWCFLVQNAVSVENLHVATTIASMYQRHIVVLRKLDCK